MAIANNSFKQKNCNGSLMFVTAFRSHHIWKKNFEHPIQVLRLSKNKTGLALPRNSFGRCCSNKNILDKIQSKRKISFGWNNKHNLTTYRTEHNFGFMSNYQFKEIDFNLLRCQFCRAVVPNPGYAKHLKGYAKYFPVF